MVFFWFGEQVKLRSAPLTPSHVLERTVNLRPAELAELGSSLNPEGKKKAIGVREFVRNNFSLAFGRTSAGIVWCFFLAW